MRLLGLSQRDLAKGLRCTRAAVGHYLSGRRRPSLDQIEAIADLLKVDLLWLMRGESAAGIAEPSGASQSYQIQIPVAGTTDAGLTRAPSGRLRLGVGSQGCYGLLVQGSAYSPRMYANEIAVFDPEADAGPGDEVFIQFRDRTCGLFSLVNRGKSQMTLENFTGDRHRRRVNASDVRTIHKLIAVFRAND